MKTLNINCPEGYTIDQDKSDLTKGIVHFKECKKIETYEDVARELFTTECYRTRESGKIIAYWLEDNDTKKDELSVTNSTTREQLESILALNQLCNVAKYLNGNWLPVINDSTMKYSLFMNNTKDISINFVFNTMTSVVYFKTKELAKQAVDILGEDVIRQALTLNH